MYTLYVSTESSACSNCLDAVTLLEDADAVFEKVPVSGEVLRALFPSRNVHAFPVLARDGVPIGSLDEIRELVHEPLLCPGPDRFAFDSNNAWAVKFFDDAQASFWMTKEIRLADDIGEWEALDASTREFVTSVLAFFFAADGIVGESLVSRYMEMQDPACRAFLGYQLYNEQVHSQTYAVILKTLITNDAERQRVIGQVANMPHIRGKTTWSMRWLDPRESSYAERTVAFACVELVFFSSSFCTLFWIRRKGVLKGVTFSNELISRDEGLHGDFACALFRQLRRKPSPERVLQIVIEAAELEMQFVDGALKADLIGMKPSLLKQHVQYMADRVLLQLGYRAHYNVQSPYLELCERQSLQGHTNFFERNVSEYQRGTLTADSAFGDVNDLI
jgi:ribonucleotide reductase beta subunit family protein with ferritin-like domain